MSSTTQIFTLTHKSVTFCLVLKVNIFASNSSALALHNDNYHVCHLAKLLASNASIGVVNVHSPPGMCLRLHKWSICQKFTLDT